MKNCSILATILIAILSACTETSFRQPDIRLSRLRLTTKDVRRTTPTTETATVVLGGTIRDLTHEQMPLPTLRLIWYSSEGEIIYQGPAELRLENGCYSLGPDDQCQATFELLRDFEIDLGHRHELTTLDSSGFEFHFTSRDQELKFEYNPVGSLRIVNSPVEFNRITP